MSSLQGDPENLFPKSILGPYALTYSEDLLLFFSLMKTKLSYKHRQQKTHVRFHVESINILTSALPSKP